MVERREFKRLPADAEVTIRPVDRDQLKTARSKNISGGGILLQSNKPFEPGALLDIEVVGPTHRKFSHVFPPLRARVRVVRVEGDGPPYDIAGEFVSTE